MSTGACSASSRACKLAMKKQFIYLHVRGVKAIAKVNSLAQENGAKLNDLDPNTFWQLLNVLLHSSLQCVGCMMKRKQSYLCITTDLCPSKHWPLAVPSWCACVAPFPGLCPGSRSPDARLLPVSGWSGAGDVPFQDGSPREKIREERSHRDKNLIMQVSSVPPIIFSNLSPGKVRGDGDIYTPGVEGSVCTGAICKLEGRKADRLCLRKLFWH